MPALQLLMSTPEICGYVAMLCTTTSVVPQAIKCWRTKEVKDVAVSTWSLIVVASIFWLIYAYSIGSVQLMITNSCVFIGSFLIVLAKLIFGRNDPHDLSRRERHAAVIKLLEEWVADDMSDDEDAWLRLKARIEESRTSTRKRFEE